MYFDIILPTTGRDSLARAVASVYDQTHKQFRLWIMFDGCEAPDWAEGLPGQTIFLSRDEPGNDFGAAARNQAFYDLNRSTKNDSWIAYIDDDDIWLPHHLVTLVNMANENPDATMLRTAGQSFSMKHKSPRSSKLKQKLGPVNTTDILTVGMCHTRELFLQTPGWQPQDNHDHLLWKHMLDVGGVSQVTDAVTFLFER